MTPYTVKVNNKQMSVMTPLSRDKLLRELGWKWPDCKIELVEPQK